MNYTTRLIISIIIDVVDFGFGILDKSFPIVGQLLGTIWDVLQAIIAVYLWGESGLIRFVGFWEVIEPTNTIDSFVPTLTIIGLLSKKNY